MESDYFFLAWGIRAALDEFHWNWIEKRIFFAKRISLKNVHLLGRKLIYNVICLENDVMCKKIFPLTKEWCSIDFRFVTLWVTWLTVRGKALRKSATGFRFSGVVRKFLAAKSGDISRKNCVLSVKITPYFSAKNCQKRPWRRERNSILREAPPLQRIGDTLSLPVPPKLKNKSLVWQKES